MIDHDEVTIRAMFIAGFVRAVMIEEWGPRCPDVDPDCLCCEAWKKFDELIGEEK